MLEISAPRVDSDLNACRNAGERPPPYVGDIGVLALVPDVWGGPWQLRHQILTRLARYFHVVWCDPALWWRSSWQLGTQERQSVRFGPEPPPGLTIYRPEPWLPELGRPSFLARWTKQERLRRAQQMLEARGCRKTIVYLWRPAYAGALDLVNYDFSCYHIDDEYTFSAVEVPLQEEEANLIRRVDQVFIHSPALLEKKGGLNPNTLFVPNGVDYDSYARRRDEPADMAHIPRPRIGYTGQLKAQLDWPLISHLTRQHRDWSFVFVGPQAPHSQIPEIIHELSRRPNVYFLGAKSVEDLAGYPQHFDVCVMPYQLNDYTNYIYPLKLHEYLASGRPVVGAPIRSLREFAASIRLANGTDEWSRALTKSLNAPASAASCVEARRSVARRYDWDRIVWRIAHTFCAGIDPALGMQLEKVCHGETLPLDAVRGTHSSMSRCTPVVS